MEVPFSFNQRGLHPDAPPKTLECRILCLALCASQATYDGLSTSNFSSKSGPVGGEVVFTEGQQEVTGTIVEADEDTGNIVVQGKDGTNYTKTCHCVESVCQFSRAAALETLSKYDTGATHIMWSSGFGRKESVEAGSPHPHLIIESHLVDKPTLVVACRGSVTSSDWKSDFSAFRLARSCATWESSIHGGFLERAETIPIEPFIQHLKDGGSVLFTGHSLGSAVAEVLCIKVVNYIDTIDPSMESALHGRLAFIGFASPVVCTEERGATLRRAHGEIFHHFQTENDIVPLLSNVTAVSNTQDLGKAKNAITSVNKHFLSSLLSPHSVILKNIGLLFSKVLDVTTPKLTKGFGWWYYLTSKGTEQVLIKTEIDAQRLIEKESRRVTQLSPSLLAEGVAGHLMQKYRESLQCCLVPLPTLAPCVPQYIFPLDKSTLACAARHDTTKIAVHFETCKEVSVPASMIVNIVKSEVTINGQKVSINDAPKMLQYITVLQPPFSRSFMVYAGGSQKSAEIVVTFRSLYTMADGVPQSLNASLTAGQQGM